ncbi:hypothetical protein CJF31_00008867 [Rutstroemia sp. NJR-2017a BVV2]|nr:hypothetical protein CJF31_00008867 [Rutstroemia sp. NJR-2017a BVV2]
MLNPSRDLQQSAHLCESLRRGQTKKGNRSRDRKCENANTKDSPAVCIDFMCVKNENSTEQRQSVTLTRRFYLLATRVITLISTGIENQSREIKLSRRTRKAIAFVFACLCASLLMQNPSGMSSSKTGGTELARGGTTANPSGPSRWSANTPEELLREFGDQKAMHKILKKFVSLVEGVCRPSFLSKPHPFLLLFTNVVFAFPITYLRHTNGTDKHQDDIIAGGLILMITAASMTGNVWETAMTLLPWSIILGLLLSSLIHQGFGFGRSSDESYMEGI